MTELKSFRLLLFFGAFVSAVLGMLGWFAPSALRAVLGLNVDAALPGFVGLARLYGGLSFAIALGFGIAAGDPRRQRGLLAVLFVVPVVVVLSAIVGVAGQQAVRVQGVAFAAGNLAYALLYFRLYPRTEARPPEVEV